MLGPVADTVDASAKAEMAIEERRPLVEHGLSVQGARACLRRQTEAGYRILVLAVPARKGL